MGFMEVIRVVAVLAAAIIIGRWFLYEVKKAKQEKAVWYKPYISPPGLMIIFAAIFLPFIIWMLER